VTPGETQRNGIPIGLACSLAAHVAVIAIVLAWPAATEVARSTAPETIDIVTVDPAPASIGAPSKPPGEIGPVVDPAMGRTGKRAARPQRVGPPPDPYADLVMSIDDGTTLASGAGTVGDGPGRGLLGAGYDGALGNGLGGGGGGGIARIPVPRPSLARGPRPRADYSRSNRRYPEIYAGETIIVELGIDADGHVTQTELVKGLGSMKIEDDVMSAIRSFEFWPALDDDGHPIPSHYRWLWVMTSQR